MFIVLLATPYTPFRSGSLDDADGEYRATLARKHRSQFLTAEAKCSDDSTIELKSPGVLNAYAPLRTPGPFTTCAYDAVVNDAGGLPDYHSL